MEKLIAALCMIAIISACKKEESTQTTIPQTVQELVKATVGTYTTTAYCSSGNGVDGYTYDTIPNATVTFTILNDSMLKIDNWELRFIGNLNDKQYQFQTATAPSNSANLIIDSTLTSIQYCYHVGGIGGGQGCCYYGSK